MQARGVSQELSTENPPAHVLMPIPGICLWEHDVGVSEVLKEYFDIEDANLCYGVYVK